jgi:hypothetical protein
MTTLCFPPIALLALALVLVGVTGRQKQPPPPPPPVRFLLCPSLQRPLLAPTSFPGVVVGVSQSERQSRAWGQLYWRTEERSQRLVEMVLVHLYQALTPVLLECLSET